MIYYRYILSVSAYMLPDMQQYECYLIDDCYMENNAWGYLKYHWLIPGEVCCVSTLIKFHVKLEKYPATVSEVFLNQIWGIIAKKVWLLANISCWNWLTISSQAVSSRYGKLLLNISLVWAILGWMFYEQELFFLSPAVDGCHIWLMNAAHHRHR